MGAPMAGGSGGPELDPIDLGVLKGSRTVAIASGVISLALGVAVMVWPDHAIKAVAVIAGIFFLISGIATTLDALFTHRQGSYWGLLLFRGILDIVVGLVAIFYPEITVAIVAILVGANLFIGGIVQLALARQVPKDVEQHSHYLWRGIFWMIAGVVVALFAGAAATLFAFVVGAMITLSGIMLLFIGFQLGKAERQLT